MSLVATELSLQDEFNETQSAEKSIILAILAELGMDSALATDLCSKEDIQNFFKSKMKSVDPTTLSTADLFRKMGFGMTAPLIQDWLNDKDNHFMVEEWLMYFIQNSFQRNAPLPQWAEAENSGQEFSFQGAWDSGDQTRTFKQGHIPGSSPSDDLNEEIQLAIAESSEDEDCMEKCGSILQQLSPPKTFCTTESISNAEGKEQIFPSLTVSIWEATWSQSHKRVSRARDMSPAPEISPEISPVRETKKNESHKTISPVEMSMADISADI